MRAPSLGQTLTSSSSVSSLPHGDGRERQRRRAAMAISTGALFMVTLFLVEGFGKLMSNNSNYSWTFRPSYLFRVDRKTFHASIFKSLDENSSPYMQVMDLKLGKSRPSIGFESEEGIPESQLGRLRHRIIKLLKSLNVHFVNRVERFGFENLPEPSAKRRELREDRGSRRKILEERSAKIEEHRSLHLKRKITNKCWSKSERHLYHKALVSQPSWAISKRLNAYAVMHKRCVEPINDWVAFYQDEEKLEGVDAGFDVKRCKYLFWISPTYAGLGNRLASLTSAFLYAVLTDRAIVISNDSNVAELLCEPIPDSSWLVDSKSFTWLKVNTFHRFPRVKDYRELYENGTHEFVKSVYINLKYNCEEEDWHFFCPKEQKVLHVPTFAFIHTDEYLVPAFYLIPQFRKDLFRLFPDGLVFTHLARYLLHPNNYLWDRITRVYHSYLAHSDSLVGIQVRTFHETDQDTEPRVLECAMNVTKYLPKVISQEDWKNRLEEMHPSVQKIATNPNPKVITVFVASLQLHHFEHLKKVYTDGQTEDGTIVNFHYESADMVEQKNNRDQYERALTEIWLLSFSDRLLTSEWSSFGFIAAGLAGIEPFEMNIADGKEGTSYKTNMRGVCSLGAVEPCYLVPPEFLPCTEPPVDPATVSKFVGPCLHIQKGLVLQSSRIEEATRSFRDNK